MVPDRSRIVALSLIVIAGAGLAAYVALEWYASQPVDEAAAGEIVDQGRSNLESMQRDLEAEIARRPKSEAQQRLDSPLGQALFRKCSEWVEFYENHPGEEVRGHRDRACREYRDYVDDGTLPPRPGETSGT